MRYGSSWTITSERPPQHRGPPVRRSERNWALASESRRPTAEPVTVTSRVDDPPSAPTPQAHAGPASSHRSCAPEIGAVLNHVLPPDVLRQPQRRMANRGVVPGAVRAVPPSPQPPRAAGSPQPAGRPTSPPGAGRCTRPPARATAPARAGRRHHGVRPLGGPRGERSRGVRRLARRPGPAGDPRRYCERQHSGRQGRHDGAADQIRSGARLWKSLWTRCAPW